MILAHVNEPIEPPSRLAPDVPADLEAVLMRCLAKDPSDRYQSVEELLRALDQCKDAHNWSKTGRRMVATAELAARTPAAAQGNRASNLTFGSPPLPDAQSGPPRIGITRYNKRLRTDLKRPTVSTATDKVRVVHLLKPQ